MEEGTLIPPYDSLDLFYFKILVHFHVYKSHAAKKVVVTWQKIDKENFIMGNVDGNPVNG